MYPNFSFPWFDFPSKWPFIFTQSHFTSNEKCLLFVRISERCFACKQREREEKRWLFIIIHSVLKYIRRETQKKNINFSDTFCKYSVISYAFFYLFPRVFTSHGDHANFISIFINKDGHPHFYWGGGSAREKKINDKIHYVVVKLFRDLLFIFLLLFFLFPILL